MPTVTALSAPYGNFLLGPRAGPGVCEVCFDLTSGPPRCHHCARPDDAIATVAPISYSVAHEQLHHALRGYKRPPADVAQRFQLELAAVVWRHLDRHETCLAHAAGVAGFQLVTTVPSSHPARDRTHPLHRIAGELCSVTRGRYRRVLTRTDTPVTPRAEQVDKFVSEPLEGEPVLLIDDTWTTGANARCAAGALARAGAGPIAVLVIGRHLRRDYGDNRRRLAELSTPFEWGTCAHHARVDSNRRTPVRVPG
jgi:predicted amidophosphoribosyltransferase